MAQPQQNQTEIHDHHLKIPKILSVTSNEDCLIIKFKFIRQAEQSIDNEKGHGGGAHAGHKHGDEVVTIRKELQFHEIETEIKYNDPNNNTNTNNNNNWISLGGFRMIHILEKAHSHSHSHSHGSDNKKKDEHGHNHHNHNHNDEDDSIILCYPSMEINQYLNIIIEYQNFQE